MNKLEEQLDHLNYQAELHRAKRIGGALGGNADRGYSVCICSSERFINQADIIIGHNSAATIEALANSKYVMVPFFEKKLKLKRYLLNFSEDIIYPSKMKMKKT